MNFLSMKNLSNIPVTRLEQFSILDPKPADLHSLYCVSLCCFLLGIFDFFDNLLANAVIAYVSLSSKKEERGAM